MQVPGLMERNKTNREGRAEVKCRWTPSLLDIAHASGDPSYHARRLTLFGIVYHDIRLPSPLYRTVGEQVSLKTLSRFAMQTAIFLETCALLQWKRISKPSMQ